MTSVPSCPDGPLARPVHRPRGCTVVTSDIGSRRDGRGKAGIREVADPLVDPRQGRGGPGSPYDGTDRRPSLAERGAMRLPTRPLAPVTTTTGLVESRGGHDSTMSGTCSAGRRRGADVRAFALLADEAEELDGAGAGGSEPVRGAGVELRGLAGLEDEVVLAEDQAERAVEDVDPVIALVGAQVGLGVVASGREDELVGLDSAGSAGERQDDRAVAAGDRAQVDAGVAGGRRVDELVEGDPVGASERQQLLERGAPQAGLEPGQRAGGDAGLRGEVGERDVAAQAKAASASVRRRRACGPCLRPFRRQFAIRQHRFAHLPLWREAYMLAGCRDARIRQGLLGAALAGSRRWSGSMAGNPPNPYLARETATWSRARHWMPGAEAAPKRSGWRPSGWQVTAADISSRALARAAERAAPSEPRRARAVGRGGSERLGARARSSTWSRPTTPTRRCRSWSSTTASPDGWLPAARC